MPRREELGRAQVALIKAGGPRKADLLVVDPGGAPLVVKDFANKRWWVRLAGRLQIARECRAYRWVGEVQGLPHLVGRIDAHALALERIDGVQLASSPRRFADGPALLERLRRLVERLHEAGLVHLDLRGRGNVMLGTDGEVYVVDLAGAVWLRPGGLAHRLLFRWLKAADDAALLKWKRLLEAGPYSDQEIAFLRRHRFWRTFWIFTRKGQATRGRGR